MIQPIVLYSNIDDHDTILELWEASTKHPDVVFHFSDFAKTPWISNSNQIFQWLLECASKLTFPFHAKELCDFAIEYYEMEKG